jgi:hypothetical protein
VTGCPVIGTCLDDEDGHGRIFGEPCGDRHASKASSHYDVVERLTIYLCWRSFHPGKPKEGAASASSTRDIKEVMKKKTQL